ncbi:glycosyl transferase family 1 [Solemya pervernicosa gill symbiont]|uniref:Glycosyl transferase family 1 n=2 Tax=Gammaproteobacteria incertae sedis TaxID=118884 RepID=A0A1T2L758_9GAMM|nr:glycosyltransferase family 4 protein [Candidatus Reidiella endopervernicosa]OOZ40892.1 glycosyl transferase family 1 [Solemya pervernicosa gill symbiont]QKQ26137.1 glycosyltransferase [Candidatus Reidiella endopervernicosa]
MRVLHFYKNAIPESMGGVEQVIHQIASGTSTLGIQCDVLSLSHRPSPSASTTSGYRTHQSKLDLQIASNSLSLSVFSKFSKLAKRADLIHYHFPWPFMDLVHFATRVNKPSIVTYHSDIVRQRHLRKIYYPLMIRFLNNVDAIAATSHNYLETSKTLKRFKQKVVVIPPGLDRESYPNAPTERLNYWRNKFGDRFFLFVGVLRYYKGLHILLEAAHKTGFPVVIVGAGPTENELKNQAKRLGLKKTIFLGHIPDTDKVALLQLCYGILFPSHMRSEAFGISLLEGAMFGKPMISSEIGTGTTYANIAGETGLVVPPSDPGALSNAMHYLWEHPAKAAEMGENAAQRFNRLFTIDRMAHKYSTLYHEIVERGH